MSLYAVCGNSKGRYYSQVYHEMALHFPPTSFCWLNSQKCSGATSWKQGRSEDRNPLGSLLLKKLNKNKLVFRVACNFEDFWCNIKKANNVKTVGNIKSFENSHIWPVKENKNIVLSPINGIMNSEPFFAISPKVRWW